MTKPHPDAVRLATRAFAENLKMTAVLERAEVARSTWWRIRNGRDFHASVIQRIEAAIEAMIKEQAQ